MNKETNLCVSMGFTFLCSLLIMIVIVEEADEIKAMVKEQNRLTEVHLLIPSNSESAIKVSYNRDTNGEVTGYSVNRVFKWKTGLKQALKPEHDKLANSDIVKRYKNIKEVENGN